MHGIRAHARLGQAGRHRGQIVFGGVSWGRCSLRLAVLLYDVGNQSTEVLFGDGDVVDRGAGAGVITEISGRGVGVYERRSLRESVAVAVAIAIAIAISMANNRATIRRCSCSSNVWQTWYC